MGMKLRKFRIQNYKSIKDSSYCWLASDLTVLAGKNESGKSAILEALRDFDVDVKSIPDSALPLDNSREPLIEMCFQVDKGTLDKIVKESGITLVKEPRAHIEKNGLTIFKDRVGDYRLDTETWDLINKEQEDENEKLIRKIESTIQKLKKHDRFSAILGPDLDSDIEVISAAIVEFLTQARGGLPSVSDAQQKQESNRLINEITNDVGKLRKGDSAGRFLSKARGYIPHLIFFSDFSDILPFEIPLAEATNHQTVQDFAKVAGLHLEEVVRTTDSQRRRNILKDHSAIITGDFTHYYGQDRLELLAEPDGDKIRFGVQEFGKTTLYKIEQRSKGLQWFLSFYLRLNSEKGENNIILVDEPGLYVHAKAQKDILTVFEREIAAESQVIFSTHSPYLIDPDRLDRVRLVLKLDKGTIIEGKIHKGADAETLTPIVTAIGLDLAQGFAFPGKRNVLLEGISDYYFLQAIKVYTPKSLPSDVCLIPCVGAQKIPQLVSLLIGWDLEFMALLDSDSEGKRVAKLLSGKLGVSGEKIITVAERDAVCIEDLFTHEDFNEYVLEDLKNEDEDLPNSKFLKNHKLDKVLLAKNFFERVNNNKAKVNLTKETLGNFKEVFKGISQGFSD